MKSHPGEILKKQFLEKNGISVYRLAKSCRLSQTRIGQIINKKRGITPETALKIAKFLGNKAEYWLELQNEYELDIARKELKKDLDLIQKFK
jgi:addiction module HigA family antidote